MSYYSMTIDKPFHFFLIPGFNLFTLVAQIMMLFHKAVKVLDKIIHACQLDLYTCEIILLLLSLLV